NSFARPDLRCWYMHVAQGGSLYKKAAREFMTKTETHHFLNPPETLFSTQEAFWYAFARAHTDDRAIAFNISRTRLFDFSVASSFWKEVARYFARNPISIQEMNDLIDFFLARKEEDENFSLKGRSLPALRRRMEEWHRALRKQQTIGGGSWDGRPIPDVEYRAGRDDQEAIWRFRQIKTGNDLYREGQQMHHCVSTYKGRCMSGDISIWSLSYEFPSGRAHRGVTMEVRSDGMIAQCRGFANRLPYPNEVAMVKRWARDYDLTWKNWSW